MYQFFTEVESAHCGLYQYRDLEKREKERRTRTNSVSNCPAQNEGKEAMLNTPS